MRERIPHITQQGLVSFLQAHILRDAPRRRKLSIHALSHAIPDISYQKYPSCGTPLPDISAWRA